MKILILGVFSFCCFSIVYASQIHNHNSLDNDKLNGEVKSIIISEFNTVDSLGIFVKGERAGLYYSINKFYNLKGNIILEEHGGSSFINYNYDLEDNLIEEQYYDSHKKNEIIYSYDNNKLINQSLYGFVEDTNKQNVRIIYNDTIPPARIRVINESIDYTYDSLNRMKIKTTKSYIDKKYDEYGEETSFYLKSPLVTKNIIEYDTDNRIKLIISLNKTLKSKVDFFYHNKGHNEIKSYFNSDSTLTYKDSISYNLEGNIIKETIYYNYNGGTLNQFIYKYDSNHNVIEYIKLVNNEITFKRVYKYNYDFKNNWIMRTTMSEGIPTYIHERKISYY
ncbi:MAG: hypothetical protein H6587_11845 [Flavobacteriales bacterium]|nr:hypothetical protein [Flavobacteriales bacterium]MCB9365255.1 hypothetical protein [Flavobacteriales bacterium]